jgi:VWFA-related protein
MTRHRTSASLLLGLALAPCGLVAQEPDRSRPSRPAPVFPTEAHIVWIDLVAADPGGRPVADLDVADFEVLEEGERRPIVLFKAPDPRPASRALVFLIDDITTSTRQVRQARDAVKRVLSKAAAGDRIVLMAPASGVEASAEAPAGTSALRAQLDRVRSHPDLRAARGDPELARRLDWGRVEAVVKALEALSGHRGPRALVVIGSSLPYRADGPFGTAAYERVMRASEQAAAPVYLLGFGEEASSPRPSLTLSPDWITGKGSVIGVAPLLPMAPGGRNRPSSAVLDAVSSDSGGFATGDAAGWSWALERILATRAYYLLGIPSAPESWDGDYHRVDVRVLRPDVRLYARKGYFTPEAGAAPDPR